MFVEIVAPPAHDVERSHYHSGCAEAALQPVIFAEGLLHGMQRTIRFGQPLYSGDLGALALQSERRAGFGCDAVNMNNAGPALGRIASNVRTGQPQVFAQELHQQGARFDVTGDGFAVHRHGHGWHDLPPKFRAKSPLFASIAEDGRGCLQKRADFGPISLWNMNNFGPRLWAWSSHSEGENRCAGQQYRVRTPRPSRQISEKNHRQPSWRHR